MLMLARGHRHAHTLMIARTLATQAAGPANVWCVGRNYAEHIKELGNDPSQQTEEPMIFLKSGSSLLASDQPLQLPVWSSDVHHEVELGIYLNAKLEPSRAVAALDLTARDVQARLKEQRWPWSLAKSFPSSTPVGTAFDIEGMNLQTLELLCQVNGKTRQQGSASQMIFRIDNLLKYIKSRFPVVPGDLILTGTPAGVSPIRAGDRVVAQVLSPGGGKVLSQGSWDVVQGQ